MANNDPASVSPYNMTNNFSAAMPTVRELYFGNYTTIPADCSKSDLSIKIGAPLTPLQVGVTSNVPVTVTNSGRRYDWQ